MPSFARLTPSHVTRLREILGDDGLLVDDGARDRYGRDETEAHVVRPEAVCRPTCAEQVGGVLALANAERLPVTPRGAGTGLSGGALPVAGGLVLTLERLDRVRSIDRVDLVAEVEAGVVTGELQRRVEAEGLYYPPDPASRDTCQIGGNIAEDSAGPRSCKYGSTRRWVLGLEAVLADGTPIRTGGRNRKDATGYPLTQLLVGSEGTLAVVTAATLRLIAQPAARLSLALPFPSLERAAEAVTELFARSVEPSACELLEEAALAVVGQLVPIPAALSGGRALLVLELDGDDRHRLLDRAAAAAEVAAELGGGDALVADTASDQRRLWAIRERVAEAVRRRSVYKEADTVVPRSALVDLVRAARRAAERQGLEAVCYGHAGDGNLHVNLLRGDLDDATWESRRDAAEGELFRAVTELGGTLSGEHGIGWTQRRHLGLALRPAAVDLMRRVKQAFDPLGILNPEKIFPDDGDPVESGSR